MSCRRNRSECLSVCLSHSLSHSVFVCVQGRGNLVEGVFSGVFVCSSSVQCLNRIGMALELWRCRRRSLWRARSTQHLVCVAFLHRSSHESTHSMHRPKTGRRGSQRSQLFEHEHPSLGLSLLLLSSLIVMQTGEAFRSENWPAFLSGPRFLSMPSLCVSLCVVLGPVATGYCCAVLCAFLLRCFGACSPGLSG